MTYTPKIYGAQIANNGDAVTLEEIYRKYAAFGGVHACEFDDDINTFDPDKWTELNDITYSDDQIVNAGDASERLAWFTDDMPHSYTMEFTYHGAAWGALLRGDGISNYYRVDFSTIAVSVRRIDSGTESKVWSKECSFQDLVGMGRIKISVRDAQTSSDTSGRMIYISIWLNDKPLYTVADSVLTNTPPLKMGIILPLGSPTGVVYSDFRIPNMGELVQFSAMSPGDTPATAIGNAIEDRYIKAWVRWNGKLKAYRPHARSLSGQISSRKDLGYQVTTDKRQSFSHIRLLGAFQWVQLIDPDLVNAVGHRFKELNNTSLWNADDCYRIAQQMFIRVKEQVFQAQIQTTGMLFNEVEDRIQFPDPATAGSYIDYIIDSIDWEWRSGAIETSITGRKYFWGEP